MDNYSMINILNNLYEAFKYRGLTPLSEKTDDLTYMNSMYIDNYFLIKTVDENNKKVYVIITHYDSEIYKKAPAFKVLEKKLYECDQALIITKEKFSSHVNKFIATLKNVNIMNFIYDNFMIIIPNHALTCKHEILSSEEANKVLSQMIIKKQDMSKIKLYDPLIIWSKGKVGDIVKIHRYDEITGRSFAYRVIIK